MGLNNSNNFEDLDSANIDAAQAYFGTHDDESSLGFSVGGIKVKVEEKWIDMFFDRYGEQPINKQLSGRITQVSLSIGEVALENVSAALAGTAVLVDGGKKLLIVGSGTGLNARRDSLAKSLVVVPVINNIPTTNRNLWLRFRKALPMANLELNFDGKTQQKLDLIFDCMPDDDGVIFTWGDESAS